MSEEHFEVRHRALREADAAARAAWLEDAVDTSETIAAARRLDLLEARTGPLVDDLVELARGMDGWLSRASQFVNAVVVMADDRNPGLALLADMAAWNDRRKALLAALDEASR